MMSLSFIREPWGHPEQVGNSVTLTRRRLREHVSRHLINLLVNVAWRHLGHFLLDLNRHFASTWLMFHHTEQTTNRNVWNVKN